MIFCILVIIKNLLVGIHWLVSIIFAKLFYILVIILIIWSLGLNAYYRWNTDRIIDLDNRLSVLTDKHNTLVGRVVWKNAL